MRIAFLESQKAERIWMLAKIEFRQRYYEHKAGMLWALVKPIADSLIYFFVFTFVMKNNIPNFALYLFLGLIFSGIFNECAGGKIFFLAEKKSIYEYSNMNKWEIYVSSIMANFIGFLFNLIVFFLLAFIIGDHFHITYSLLLLPLLILISYVICIAWSIILSTAYLFFRDISQIWQIFTTILFWSSPVVLDQKLYTGKVALMAYVHPFSSMVSCSRDIVLYHQIPTIQHSSSLLVTMFFWLFVATICMKKYVPLASEKL